LKRRKKKKVNKKIIKNETPPVKRGRGRPRKEVKAVEATPAKRRGRPPKVKTPLPAPLKKEDKLAGFRRPVKLAIRSKPAMGYNDTPQSPQELQIASHPLYNGSVWLLSKLPPHEEEYIKKMARKRGTTPLNTIMEHILDFFAIRGTELGQALKETHKPV